MNTLNILVVNDDLSRVGVCNIADYSAFGVQLDGRTKSTEQYRCGFQGQETDDEVKGEGNSVNYKYRMHDPRIGRFFAVDPLMHQYSYNSPYAFSENVVINAVELEGKEKDYSFFDKWEEQRRAEFVPLTAEELGKNRENFWKFQHGYYKGVGKSVYNFTEFVTNPVETVKGVYDIGVGIYNLSTDPTGTLESMAEPFISEDPEVAGEAFGGLAGDVVTGGVTGTGTLNLVKKSSKLRKAKSARKAVYLKRSSKWTVGSLSDAIDEFAGGRIHVSEDGVKTRYYNKDESKVVIYDNENDYFRIFDENRGQFLDSNGNIPTPNKHGLVGKEAKDFVPQQTHIRNTDE